MSAMAPLYANFEVALDALGATADGLYTVAAAPWLGTIVGVTYAPNAAVTGAATNTRTLNILNGGQTGAGTTNMASLPLVSGTNMTADHPTALPLSGTAANLAVNAGDIVQFQSVHAGTGIADPGGTVYLTLSRS